MLYFAFMMLVLVAMFIIETYQARGSAPPMPRGRMAFNVLVGSSVFLVQLTAGTIVAIPSLASQKYRGLLDLLAMPYWVSLLLGFFILSFAAYVQHRYAHRWAWLWRLHKVHHSDNQLDITTAFRHHPLEALISIVWFALIGLFFAIPPETFVAYGVVAMAFAIMQHSDIRHPTPRYLSILALPSLHRMHHSADRHQTDSNYGDVLLCWDHLFGTFSPADGPQRIGLGEDADRDAHELLPQLFGRRSDGSAVSHSSRPAD